MHRSYFFRSMMVAGVLCLAVLSTTSVYGQSEGQADLDSATALKLSSSTMADLERVVELCESAIEKGLDPESEKLAKSLITATLFQHGSRFAQALFDPQDRPRRPAMLKQFALRDLYKVLEYDDTLPQVHMMIARLEAVTTGRPQENAIAKGRASADRAIELLAENESMLSKALVLRAGYAPADPTNPERMEYLNRAIQADPTNSGAWRLRGKQRLVQGETLAAQGLIEEAQTVRQQAIEDFTQLLEENPDDPDALQAVAELLGRLGDVEQAMAHANRALDQNPQIASLYILRGRLYRQQKMFDEAIKDLNRAIDIQPDSYIALLDRAETHYEQDNKKAAAKDYGVARDLQGQNLWQTVLLRITVLSSGDIDKRVDGLRRFVEIDSLNAETEGRSPEPTYRLQLGQTYVMTNRPMKGIATLTAMLENIDDDSRDARSKLNRFLAFRSRADGYLSVGKHAEAIADYDEAIQLQPNDDQSLNNLAWVLATSPFDEVRNADRAIELATKASKVTDYKEAHILSTLAAAYAESGDFELAKEWSAKAVELGDTSTSPETQTQLKNELESYKQGKPWRELQNVEQQQDETSSETSEQDAADDEVAKQDAVADTTEIEKPADE